jgi:serine/threonine-protein kinase
VAGQSDGGGEAPTPSSPELGVVAGRYKILQRIAEGGMGVVYKAEHTLSRKKLAIKVLHPHLSHGKQAVERFKREVSAAAEIDHPGIVQVFDAGVDTDGSFYMAMELLAGESLASRARTNWPGTKTAVQLVIGMCDPLAKAHEKGFVHRDLKPDNVFIAKDDEGRERVKILDFGLVREVSTRRGPTMTGVTFGTPEYMSPEQAMSAKKAGIPADVWSLGVILYELLAGRHPFTGETPNAVMANAIKEPFPPLAEVAPHVPGEVAAVVEKCLTKDPAGRPANAGELGVLLRDVAQRVELDDAVPLNPEIRRNEGEDDEGDDGVDIPLASAAIPVSIDLAAAQAPPRRAAVWPWAAGALGVVAMIGAAGWAYVQRSRGRDGDPITATPLGPPATGAIAAVGPDPGAVDPGAVDPAAVATDPAAVDPGAAVPPGPIGDPPAADPAATARVIDPPSSDPPRERERRRPREEGATQPETETAPGEQEGPSRLAEAQACLQRADTRCAVAALQSGTTAAEMALLVEVYQAQGRSSDARAAMERYVRRYPRGPRTAEFRRALGLGGG